MFAPYIEMWERVYILLRGPLEFIAARQSYLTSLRNEQAIGDDRQDDDGEDDHHGR